MRVLAIIPARGGSKGIPGKNLIPLNGKPLIDYTLEILNHSMQAGLITDFVISTDDQGIADHCRGLGFNVPGLRPAELAQDDTKTIDVILYTCEKYEKLNSIDALLLLQPTTPLRSVNDIRQAIILLENHPDENCVISAYEKDSPGVDYFYYALDEEKAMPLSGDHASGLTRQVKKNVLIRNGAIYLTRIPFIIQFKKIISENPLYIKMPEHFSINIDSVDDLSHAEAILRYFKV